MKLIIAGASGFVGSELVRRSISMPAFTTVVALARCTVSSPERPYPGSDVSKLKSVVVKDYDEYPEEVVKELANADACIWTVAITPGKARGLPFEQVRRVCLEYALIGLKTITEARETSTKPLRFIYMSGIAAERDQTKTPRLMAEHCLMRGDAENQVLAYAAAHPTQVEACAAKPGLIVGDRDGILKTVMATVMSAVGVVPNIGTDVVVAAMLDQVLNGFETEPLVHADLVRIGTKALEAA